MPLMKRFGLDPAGVGAGVVAAYGTKLALLFVIVQYRIFFTSNPPDIQFFNPDSVVSDLPFASLILHGALVLGALVGGYVGATYWHKKPFMTGVAVGAVLGGIQVCNAIIRSVRLADFAWEYMVAAVAVFLAALFGARIGELRRVSWERQCEKLDPWKQKPSDQ